MKKIHNSRFSQSISQPARLLNVASWIVAIAFAIFLNMLGSLVIRDLMYAPRGGPPVATAFSDPATAPLEAHQRDLELRRDTLSDKLEIARTGRERADKVYSDQRESFRNWIATRQATGNGQNDPDLLARTKNLDALQARADDWRRQENALIDETRPIESQLVELRRQIADVRQAADRRFAAATRHYELVVFGCRLAVTLPLLVIGVWLFIRFRKSRYWPFVYGFGLFSLSSFFVELVPYLPNFGGYVRVLVGIALTAFAGIYMLRVFQRYVERKRAELQQSQSERARHVDYEKALRAYDRRICPSCDKSWQPGGDHASFCIHCGLNLFKTCDCGGRNFAFFPFCNQCGNAVPPEEESGASQSA
ncbi:zinc ribbon domain-containing protein [Paraburkholderia strydomiana]|uniref:zinc ribbon domain-containing protein n=1 Tax=Paraburkholderia strydomiana TaxID=1245417 RepID=UPI001BEBB809|nr:zinc ribbon domain-containing protein [Paraburkholderia strydomiana]MBT2790104.1 hypothetical protein [Paraburkholderia strydomiana]